MVSDSTSSTEAICLSRFRLALWACLLRTSSTDAGVHRCPQCGKSILRLSRSTKPKKVQRSYFSGAAYGYPCSWEYPRL